MSDSATTLSEKLEFAERELFTNLNEARSSDDSDFEEITALEESLEAVTELKHIVEERGILDLEDF